ncbi:FkbM family methyltransferase [Candidatus Marsarchaeota archaeon]|nr:FkbM family methyltransferase [Candidatus Marsarchaeota archaeon]
MIDIGGYMGDTAVYFAVSPKVKKVIAYEPTKRLYREAILNISMSPFKDKIQFKNMAIGEREQSIIYDNETDVRYIALDDVLSGLKNVAIKCDCEGAERYMFNDTNLKQVYAMAVECHYGCISTVAKRLKNIGFRVIGKKYIAPHTSLLYVKR